MDYLPVFLRLHAQPVVVVGRRSGGFAQGAVAPQGRGAHVTVVAPQLHPELGQRGRPAGNSRISLPGFPPHSSWHAGRGRRRDR